METIITPKPGEPRTLQKTIRFHPAVWEWLVKTSEWETGLNNGSVRSGGEGVVYPTHLIERLIIREIQKEAGS